ncbi:MAG: hypothetical protein AAB372_02825 [Patescibacteria group bacterium]
MTDERRVDPRRAEWSDITTAIPELQSRASRLRSVRQRDRLRGHVSRIQHAITAQDLENARYWFGQAMRYELAHDEGRRRTG